MKSGMLSNADGVLENKRRRQKWKRLAGVLGCLVMIGTTYVLMRPAETLERELICGMEEHKHSVEQGCYRQVAAEAALPICGWEEGETGHVHSDECYSEESVLTCTEPESETHRHEDSCYTTEHIQTCGLMEMKNHTHTEDCYLPADEDTETEWELICELLEHTHNEECYANDAARHIRTEEVAALIDALPSPEEAQARMAELLAAEDTEGYDAYCAELARQVERAGAAYETLTDEQRAQLNTDRLTALHAYRLANLYSVSLLAATGNITDATALKAACEAGGTVVLGADITTSNTITIASGKNTTIDLNGYKIVFTKTTKNANLFYVNGGSLTIEDSKANADGTSTKETKSKRSSIMYAESRKSLASITSNRLTYYVVESSETDATRHLTAETQWTRTVSLGGGQAGAIVGSGTSDGQVAIYQTSGTVTMKAGYICNFGNAERPGAEGISASADYDTYYSAVTIQGGTFNLEGGVLAANRSYSHGGAIYMYGWDCKLVW